jgi:TetR/AcrR family transcriptional regulator, tetracycline repressor protein
VADRRARPRAGLSRDKVLDAAIAFVDEYGLPALSTRRLAAALGVEAMTLYHYVPTKAALLDGMVERVLAQAAGDLALELNPDPAHSPPAHSPPWPEVVRAVATRFRAVLLAHPGVLGAMATRPVNSPGAIRILEAGLAIMTSQGVPLALAMDTLNSVMMFVIGHTLAEAGQTPGHEGTEPGPPAPDPAAYPNFAEAVRTGAGLDFTSRFRRTLDILIDGYAAVATATPRSPVSPARGTKGGK